MIIDNRTAAENHISQAIGDTTGFDITAIAYDLYDTAGGTWDITLVDEAAFWETVAKHDASLTDEDRADLHHDTSPGTDRILSDLVTAQESLEAVERDRDQAMRDRDALIVTARKTGASVVAIGEAIGLTRHRVYQVLKAAGLDR